MKKGFLTVVVALLCAMVCAFGLVACNNNETPNENGNNGTQTVAVESVTLNKTELTLEVGRRNSYGDGCARQCNG